MQRSSPKVNAHCERSTTSRLGALACWRCKVCFKFWCCLLLTSIIMGYNCLASWTKRLGIPLKWVVESGQASCIRSGCWALKYWFRGCRLSNIFESWSKCCSLALSSLSHGLFCISRFDCVWFLGKVSAHVLMRLEVEMPQIMHIMPWSFYNFLLILGLSKR
jgi:hypothetical protein